MAKGDLAELLMATSQELANSGNLEHKPVFELLEEGKKQALSATAGNEVCRIAVEAMRNAYRHAQAHRVEAEIRYGHEVFRVRIRDNGKLTPRC